VPAAPASTTCPPASHIFLRRPFAIGWFTNQVATYVSPLFSHLGASRIYIYICSIRCLALWEGDSGLVHALELAKNFLVPTEVLNALWPCTAFRVRGEDLREQLSRACANAGITQPPPSRAPSLLPSLAALQPQPPPTSASDRLIISSRS
jgi:hypothetical protein